MSKQLLLQRTMAVLVGVMLLTLILSVVVAVTQWSPMSEALLVTDRQWVELQDATKSRAEAASAFIEEVKDAPGAEAAVREFLRVSSAFDQLPLDHRISLFNVDRAGDFARGDRLVRQAVNGLMDATNGSTSRNRLELKAADEKVVQQIAAYNRSVDTYNEVVRKFPRRYVATPFGFYEKPRVE